MFFFLPNLVHKIKKLHYGIPIALTLFVAMFFVYWPGLSGPFVFDDFPSIVDNEALNLESFTIENIKTALFSVRTGPLYRPVSYFTFLINYQLTELNPFWFKVTNVAIHFVNSILFFFFCRSFFSFLHKKNKDDLTIISMAIFSASLWAFHPLNVTSVLYVVQRMTSLSCLFFFCTLNLYFYARVKQLQESRVKFIYFFGAFFFFVLAILSKESILTGLGVLFLLEIIFFKFLGSSLKPIRYFKPIIFLIVSSVLFIFLAILIEHNWLERSYSMRDFSLKERVMTQPRVLWLYIKMIFIPNIQDMAIFRDDLIISKGIFSPLSTFFSMLFLILGMFLSVFLVKKKPIFCFGLGWFLLGHGLESSIFSLEMMFDHRNYFPMMGFIIIIADLLNHVRDKCPLYYKNIIFILPVILCASGTWVRANTWSSDFTLYENESRNHPLSVRAHTQLAMAYVDMLLLNDNSVVNDSFNKKLYEKVTHHYNLASQLSNNDISGFVGLIRFNDIFLHKKDPNVENLLIERIAKAPITIDMNKRLKDLIGCRYSETCAISPAFLNRIINALEENPYFERADKSGFYNDFGAITLSYGLYDASVFYFKKAVVLSPQNGDYVFGLSTTYYLMGEYDKAIAMLNTIDRSTLPKSYLKKYQDMDDLLKKKKIDKT